jgi:hypothetical protein
MSKLDIYPDDPMPQNPLKEKWKEKYPPIPMPQYSQVCDGYSCMWCGRCPQGDNWKCPEEDLEEYQKYENALNSWYERHPNVWDECEIAVGIIEKVEEIMTDFEENK